MPSNWLKVKSRKIFFKTVYRYSKGRVANREKSATNLDFLATLDRQFDRLHHEVQVRPQILAVLFRPEFPVVQ